MRFRFVQSALSLMVLATIVLISMAGIPMVDFPALWDAMSPLVGRIHPLLVHFPIGLLVLAGTLDLLAALMGRQTRSATVKTCLLLGLVGAAVALGSGWVYADLEPPGRSLEETLWYHRWVGVAAGSTAALSWLFYLMSRDGERPRPRRLSRVTMFACLVLVSTTGHLGGVMVHGEAFLAEPWQNLLAYFTDEPGASAHRVAGPSDEDPQPEAVQAVEPASLLFDQVQLIFQERCIECHGPEKRKGRLRLDVPDDGLEAEDGPVVPGSPDESLLVELISLPAEDLDIMPAKGDPLSDEQIELIRDWIADGAQWP
jgi:uncharacterized membrane protein/mono/diheme cytochrome c family protein